MSPASYGAAAADNTNRWDAVLHDINHSHACCRVPPMLKFLTLVESDPGSNDVIGSDSLVTGRRGRIP